MQRKFHIGNKPTPLGECLTQRLGASTHTTWRVWMLLSNFREVLSRALHQINLSPPPRVHALELHQVEFSRVVEVLVRGNAVRSGFHCSASGVKRVVVALTFGLTATAAAVESVGEP
jgi:hypothetical protein